MITAHALYVATTFVMGAVGPSSNAETAGLIYAAWVSVDASSQMVAWGHESYASEQIFQLEIEAEALLSALEWAAEHAYHNIIVYSTDQTLVDGLRQHQLVVHQVLFQNLQAAQAAISARLEWIDAVRNVAADYLASYISGQRGGVQLS